MNQRARLEERNAVRDEPLAHAQAPRVLIAEDDEHLRRLLASTLRRDGFEVIEAWDGAELLGWIGSLLLHPQDGRQVDLIISDVRMPLVTGLDVLARLRRVDWVTPVILITAFGDETVHAEAKRLGAVAVFDKPFDLNDVRTAALRATGSQ